MPLHKQNSIGAIPTLVRDLNFAQDAAYVPDRVTHHKEHHPAHFEPLPANTGVRHTAKHIFALGIMVYRERSDTIRLIFLKLRTKEVLGIFLTSKNTFMNSARKSAGKNLTYPTRDQYARKPFAMHGSRKIECSSTPARMMSGSSSETKRTNIRASRASAARHGSQRIKVVSR